MMESFVQDVYISDVLVMFDITIAYFEAAVQVGE